MKFSDISPKEWLNLKPYLDTCLVPLTGLTGEEEPWRVTIELELLRDIMDAVEIPFKGRLLTYPAVHYRMDTGFKDSVNSLCRTLKQSGGFTYVIVITANHEASQYTYEDADLAISPELIRIAPQSDPSEAIEEAIRQLWSKDKQADSGTK